MSEWTLVWMVPLKMLPTVLFSLIYVIGGRKNKWIRRWIGGTILVLLCLLLSLMANSPLLKSLSLFSIYGGLTLGYGADTFAKKFVRRLLFGTVLGACGLLIAITYGKLWLGVLQFLFAIQSSLILGLTNPDDAVDEEAVISISSVFIIPFMVL